MTDFIRELRAERFLSAATLAQYIYAVREFATFAAARGINSWAAAGNRVVADFLSELEQRGLSETTVRRKTFAIRRLYVFLQKTGERSPDSYPMFFVKQGGPARRVVDLWSEVALGSAVRDFVGYCQVVRRVSPHTLESYALTLRVFSEFLDEAGRQEWRDVTRGDVLSYFSALSRRGYAHTTVAHHASVVKMLFEYLAANGVRSGDGAAAFNVRKPPRRLPRALSHAEIERLLNTASTRDPVSLRDRAILEMAYSSGMRSAEILGLRFSQLRLSERAIQIIGKGNKERRVFFGKPAEMALRNYLRDGRPTMAIKTPRPTDCVFLNYRGRGLTRCALWKIVRERAAAAHIRENFTPHGLRHTFATHMLLGGASLPVIQKLLGHDQITTTTIYLHLDVRHLQDAIRKFHPRG